MDLFMTFMIFIIILLAIYIFYLVIKNATNESILVSDEHKQKEEMRKWPKNALETKLNKMMKAGDHEKIR